ncbi:hypothetical protein [Flavobacterium litorale]|uniref:Anti-sigma factor n=1 Tax=Flavobacterium litorale TaxID=2856519 RepID=A0ABX8V475_9FLAO|nr:hypothetical protein [Flavobacterium litorale]QYJ67610.1 hypothetical protein K1I41_08595 [Flavobacterium litorale]
MEKEKDELDTFFNQLQNDWNTEEPAQNHERRFMDKLKNQEHKNTKPTPKRIWLRIAMPVAASVAILLGIFITNNSNNNDTIEANTTESVATTLSPEAEETQLYFASIIKKELAKIERESTPETKKIVEDAMVQMEVLEKDYEKLTEELKENGENKKIIHAMITNLQTRISFLEKVMMQIENTKTTNKKYYESNQS